MKNILSSLEAHKTDIREEDYSKLKSAKNLGKAEKKPVEEKKQPEFAMVESSESENEEVIKKDEKPLITQEVRAKYEDDFIEMDQALKVLKREIED
jgi:hypothetical protein